MSILSLKRGQWLVSVVLAGLGLLASGTAHSYSASGHLVVADIAASLLKGSRAEREYQRILGETKLRDAAVWTDCVKSIDVLNEFKYANAGRFAECAVFENKPAEEERMRDYVKRNHLDCQPKPGEESCHRQFHYTNPPYQSRRYVPGAPGTGRQDIVIALQAAIQVLRGGSSPAPINLKTEFETLALLVHLMGDVHQPLHVASVYLDAAGKIVDPGQGAIDSLTHTIGGNAITLMPSGNLHGYWDSAPGRLDAAELPALIEAARKLGASAGSSAEWPVTWASDTIAVSAPVFDGIVFSERGQSLRGPRWMASLPSDYEPRTLDLTRLQLAKAGARLAELLKAIWP